MSKSHAAYCSTPMLPCLKYVPPLLVMDRRGSSFNGPIMSISMVVLLNFSGRYGRNVPTTRFIRKVGTWIYDRAGWCPGEATDLQEFEITEIVTPGQPVEIDYGLSPAFGDSRYLVNCQLVSYGEPNFDLDARIIDIKQPSDQAAYQRVNPMCYDPVVRIPKCRRYQVE